MSECCHPSSEGLQTTESAQINKVCYYNNTHCQLSSIFITISSCISCLNASLPAIYTTVQQYGVILSWGSLHETQQQDTREPGNFSEFGRLPFIYYLSQLMCYVATANSALYIVCICRKTRERRTLCFGF